MVNVVYTLVFGIHLVAAMPTGGESTTNPPPQGTDQSSMGCHPVYGCSYPGAAPPLNCPNCPPGNNYDDGNGSGVGGGGGTGSGGGDNTNQGGYKIRVKNDSYYAAKIKLECKLNGNKIKIETYPFFIGQVKEVSIPQECSDIVLNVRKYMFFWNTDTIFTDKSEEPFSRCYKISGVTFLSHHEEVDCANI